MRTKNTYLFMLVDGSTYIGDTDNDFLSVQTRIENMTMLDGRIGHYLTKSTEDILRNRGFGHTCTVSSQQVTAFVRIGEAR